MNKIINLILPISIIFSCLFLNHLVYGNSNTRISHYEVIQYQLREHEKRIYSKKLADYIYRRILYWQKIQEEWIKNE